MLETELLGASVTGSWMRTSNEVRVREAVKPPEEDEMKRWTPWMMLASTLVVGSAVAMAWPARERPMGAAPAATIDAVEDGGWPIGRRFRYAFDLESTSRAPTLASMGLGSEAVLEVHGTLRVERLDAEGLWLEIESIDDASVVRFGGATGSLGARLEHARARVSGTGMEPLVDVPPGVDPLGARVLRVLAIELLLPTRTDSASSGVWSSPFGGVETVFEGIGTSRVSRRRGSGEAVRFDPSSSAHFTFRDGSLYEVAAIELASVGGDAPSEVRTRLDLHWLDTTESQARASSTPLVRVDENALRASPRAPSGWTIETLLDGVEASSLEGRPRPDAPTWIASAIRFLEADPEAASALAATARREEATPAFRRLALDLLASAETPECLARGSEVLEEAVRLRTHPGELDRLAQSFVGVRSPTEPMLRVLERMAGGEPEGARGAWNALGSAAAALEARGEEARANRIVADLLRRARVARGEDARALAIALVNAHASDAAALFESWRSEPDAERVAIAEQALEWLASESEG